MQLAQLFIAVLVIAGVYTERASYHNYKVYRVHAKTEKQISVLKDLEQVASYSFWSSVNSIGRPVDIMVPPHMTNHFHEVLVEHDLPFIITIDNVEDLIQKESMRVARRAKSMEWTDYHNLDEIYQWLDDLAADNANVEVVVGGQTYEGRDIKGIRVKNGDGLPGLIIESGIHAREWIGPAATSWIIDQILKSDQDSVFRKFNYLYIPNANPDGYAFTWSNDRLWRKTRKPYKVGLVTCHGADPNRNWDNHWMEGGSSNNPCSDIFAGSEAFSEVETKSLSDYFRSVSADYDLYISYHSFSQLLMFPWGYTSSHAPLHDLWQRIGDLSAASLKAVHGTEFQVGNIYDTIYQVSGSSSEWYYANFNSTITYTYETRDTGEFGFELPPEQILPCAEELLASLETILEEYNKL